MQKKTIPVKGMTCASCAATIEKLIKKMPGVKDVSVNFATEKMTVEFSPDAVSLGEMNEIIKKFGYEADISLGKEDFGKLPSADKKIISECPAPLRQPSGAAEQEKQSQLRAQRNRVLFVMPVAVIVFALMMWEIAAAANNKITPFLIPHGIYSSVLLIISTIILFWIGQPFLKGIINFIRYGAANMDTLVGIGTLSAYTYSAVIVLFPSVKSILALPDVHYFDVTVVVIGFIYLGKYLESRSKLKTADAIEKLLNLQAKTAIVIRNGKEQEVAVTELFAGDIIMVRPGGKIPVDGVIVEGVTAIDESMLTGESIPADKTKSDKVFSGTINKYGSFKFKATKIGQETLLAQIIKMVEEAQGSRAPIQRLADKISAVFVPVVLGIAVAALIVWLALGSRFMPLNQAFRFGLLSFVGVLVIACPCALGLATPTAIIVGVGKGAQNGILIKNAESLEKLHKISTLVIDKTGTITKGKPEVTDYLEADGGQIKNNTGDTANENNLRILASLEKNSEHPVAQAIVEKAMNRGLKTGKIDNFRNFEGMGIKGDFKGITYYAGNANLMDELKIPYSRTIIEKLASQGKTPVFFSNEKSLLAIVAVADKLKENSPAAIEKLHRLGIKTVMLSGDNVNTAEYIAGLAGVDKVFAQVLPQDKAEKIKELQRQGERVAMAGDGINDAPALASADVGIAMGTGADAAIESADITLLAGDISKIPQAIMLSRKTMRTIRQNLFWAFIYNIIGIPLAAGVFYPLWGILLNPVFAGLAMALSSVSVVSNSLRLKFTKL
ncbi:MAG: copper-translocating P-type ATPase [Actinobacteria bacterium]|nr:copper-translocating P-type ATPase [Actinomycetota bacterium]